MMRVFGLDPGKTTGWALVEIAVGERAVAWGTLDAAEPASDLLWLLKLHGGEFVAVEVVEHVHPVRRNGRDGISTVQAQALYDTGLLAGELIGAARAGGIAVVKVAAERWRKALVGSATAADAAIDRALRLRLPGFPAPRKSSNHERDALGVALFAGLDKRLDAARGRR